MTGEQGTLNWEQGTGEEVTGATPRGQVTGEEGRGKREEGRGKREEVRGKRFWAILLFVTCVGFFRSPT